MGYKIKQLLICSHSSQENIIKVKYSMGVQAKSSLLRKMLC